MFIFVAGSRIREQNVTKCSVKVAAIGVITPWPLSRPRLAALADQDNSIKGAPKVGARERVKVLPEDSARLGSINSAASVK